MNCHIIQQNSKRLCNRVGKLYQLKITAKGLKVLENIKGEAKEYKNVNLRKINITPKDIQNARDFAPYLFNMCAQDVNKYNTMSLARYCSAEKIKLYLNDSGK